MAAFAIWDASNVHREIENQISKMETDRETYLFSVFKEE